ncbi:MAG: DUF1778 domain-containing protein [Alphaproteobacteria bacterium]|jgi:uncharacterized protein (DUF1778 family)|nr:DUF1778 domain-containing protein [Alphaproteobacteria bacterium]MBT4018545.1 DUF1778 domain-containing protein [Alphaproteobacteria bacterium]MBT6406730.1 DUF1778 domain-containing protein [Rhodospirillaceae bacterium]
MTATAISKAQRVNLRLNGDAKHTIERAASFEGKTVSKFILASALASAEQTIHEHETMTLNKRDSEAFFDALSKPVKFNAKLLSALDGHDQRVVSK